MARIVSRHAKMARFLSSRGYSPTLVLQGDENAEHYKNKCEIESDLASKNPSRKTQSYLLSWLLPCKHLTEEVAFVPGRAGAFFCNGVADTRVAEHCDDFAVNIDALVV